MMLAVVRPHPWDFPLFLHVFGAMVLVGAVFTAALVSWVAWRRNDLIPLRRAAFWSLLALGVPAYAAMRGGAQWIYSKEGFTGDGDPSWIGIGFGAADAGLLVLLVTLGVAFWWQRSGRAIAGRIVAGLSTVYLLLLAVAWLAMSGKWG
jgi:hypothetical protein